MGVEFFDELGQRFCASVITDHFPQLLLALPRKRPGFELHFRALSASFAHEPKRWQDAYFAAFALATDVELVTFDTGFRSFAGLGYRILGSNLWTSATLRVARLRHLQGLDQILSVCPAPVAA